MTLGATKFLDSLACSLNVGTSLQAYVHAIGKGMGFFGWTMRDALAQSRLWRAARAEDVDRSNAGFLYVAQANT
jgi:hypothetical protein